MPRKHKGIIQIGGNKGKLKKGYKYTGRKTKTGIPIIKKVKKTKKQKGGNKSFINQIVGDNGVYVINLKQSTDRWESIKEQLEKRNITYTRVEATFGQDQPLEELNKYRYTGTDKENISKRNFGLTGCTMSHIKLWNSLKDKLKTDDDWALILEDDAFLIGNTNKYLEDGIKILPENYKNIGIIYLSWCWPSSECDETHKTEALTVCKFTGCQSTIAYMINKTGLQVLLDIKLPISGPIDAVMCGKTKAMDGVYGIKFNNYDNITKCMENNCSNTKKKIEEYKKVSWGGFQSGIILAHPVHNTKSVVKPGV